MKNFAVCDIGQKRRFKSVYLFGRLLTYNIPGHLVVCRLAEERERTQAATHSDV